MAHSKLGIKKVELFKDHIGLGSYGIVYKALCNDTLWCAAKVIHPVLVNLEEEEGAPEHLQRVPIQRFLLEIELLASIRHPNIVLCLGTDRDPKTKLPVLLMELMDENLTQFLESHKQPLSFDIECSISYDVALGLSFLHSNDIIHRDLSSNNVLMLGSRRAKITDFGMAKIFKGSCLRSNTKNPGNVVYMPPEVKTADPKLCFEIDIFSYGVLLVQTLTRLFPQPDDKAGGILGILKFDQEIACRQNHISFIDKDHPLLKIVLKCLKDDYKRRPDATKLCQELASAKMQSFIRRSPPKEPSHGGNFHNSAIHENMGNGEKAKRNTVAGDPRLQAQSISKPQKDKAHHYSDSCDEEEFITVDGTEFLPPPAQSKRIKVSDKSKDLSTIWSLKSTCSPQPVSRRADAVYANGYVYMLYGPEREVVYKFHHVLQSWSELEQAVMSCSNLAVVGPDITAIGGKREQKASNKLFCLLDSQWKEVGPSMPTSRYDVIVASADSHLIVAGGMDKNREILTTVEVLDLDKREWYTVSSLPEPVASFSGCVSSGKVWVLGYNNKIFSCWLKTLIYSAKKTWFGIQPSSASHDVWVYDTIPVYATTLVSVNDNLYAVGGKRSDTRKPTNAVYQYGSWDGRWYIVSYMNRFRSDCLAVGISHKRQIVVVGGVSESGCAMDSVEIARMVRSVDRFDSKSL